MAKRVRKKDVDRISRLPDAILSHILSFLSTKEAAGTSILSTRWRYLFALVPNLDFNLDHHSSWKGSKRSDIKSFESFVDRVLFFQHTARIEKFRLKCEKGVNSSRISRWITAALCRGVQHLDLSIFSPRFNTLPDVLFTCRTLVTLKLDIKIVFNVPNYACFPNLKTLHLKSIEYLNDDSVKRIFSGCINLEEMVMEECYLANISNFNISHHLLKRLTIIHSEFLKFTSNYWLVIDAPMLVYFKYKNYEAAGYSLENLQTLVSADIDFVLKDDSITNNHHQADATPFFRGIRNVQSLNLSSSTLKLLVSCEPVPVYLNMVRLKIYRPYSIRCYDYGEKELTTFLGRSPELEKLAFYQGVFSYLPEKVPSCLLFKLKEIEISEFEAGKDCIKKAKYFLKNARVLEKLTIRSRSYLHEKEKLNITEKLLASLRKSKKCCILIV